LSDRAGEAGESAGKLVTGLHRQFARRVHARAFKAFQCKSRADIVVTETFWAAFLQYERDLGGAVASKLFDQTPERQLKWLLKVANRKIIDEFRTAARREPESLTADVDDQVGPVRDVSSAQEDAFTANETSAALWKTISGCLTPNEHRVAFLSFEMGMPDAKIAEDLGMSPGTVRSHKSRAREKIEKAIDAKIIWSDEAETTTSRTEEEE